MIPTTPLEDKMLPNILTRLKESKKPTDYERNLTGAALSFCNVLSESILSISPDVHEDFAKATIKYKIGNYNFASIKPQVKKVVVRPLHIEYSEERDPKKLCRNISELKYSQSKPSEKDEVRIDFQKLSDFEDPQYAMNFIKIAYDKLTPGVRIDVASLPKFCVNLGASERGKL
jgi:predicted transport protein